MKALTVGLIIVLVISGLGLHPFWCYATRDSVTFTVSDKERIVESSGEGISSKYLVFSPGETFENTDAWWFLKFNSSDIQGRFQVGRTYTAQVYGWRVQAFSMYRNIISVKIEPESPVQVDKAR
jgi:hypothetical protein